MFRNHNWSIKAVQILMHRNESKTHSAESGWIYQDSTLVNKNISRHSLALYFFPKKTKYITIAMLHSVTDLALPYFLYTKFTISALFRKIVKYDSSQSVLAKKTLCSIANSHDLASPN